MRRLVGLAVVGLATLAPTWANADDEQIAQQIIQKLEAKKDAGLLKGFGIDLEVDNGTVWMKGTVATADQRMLALDIARRVPGVEKVVNDLALKPAMTPAPEVASKPMEMEAEVTQPPQAKMSPMHLYKKPLDQAVPRQSLSKSMEVDEQALPVPEFVPIPAQPLSQIEMNSPAQAIAEKTSSEKTSNRTPKRESSGKMGFIANLSKGIAQAMGSGSTEEPISAQSSIRQVTHEDPETTERPVKKISPIAPTLDDDQIVNRIQKSLLKEKQTGTLKGFNVDVNSKDGIVWVSGHVTNTEQHTLVIDIIRRIPGVKQVVNDLKVAAPKRSVGSVNHNDPSTPLPEGSGVASRKVRPTPYVEAVPGTDPSLASRQAMGPMQVATRAGDNSQQDPNGGIPAGMRLVPVPVQFMPAPMGMQPYYGQMPQGPYGQMPQPGYGQMPQMPQTPLAFAPSQAGGQAGGQPGGTVRAQNLMPVPGQGGTPIPSQMPTPGGGISPARYDHPNMPGYAWPSYAAYPNYAAVTYPKQYSPSAWPYIGPFYPYPQVPLGWRKVALEWDDGWWFLDFKDKH